MDFARKACSRSRGQETAKLNLPKPLCLTQARRVLKSRQTVPRVLQPACKVVPESHTTVYTKGAAGRSARPWCVTCLPQSEMLRKHHHSSQVKKQAGRSRVLFATCLLSSIQRPPSDNPCLHTASMGIPSIDKAPFFKVSLTLDARWPAAHCPAQVFDSIADPKMVGCFRSASSEVLSNRFFIADPKLALSSDPLACQ